MSRGGGETVAPGVIEDKIEERRKDSLAPLLSASRTHETFHYPLYFAMTPSSQPEGRG